MKPRFLFVAGTDTGVGKTVITTLLAMHFRQQGLRVRVCKPFASGCDENLSSEDAQFLLSRLELNQSEDEICPIRLVEPLAPLVAARRSGISTNSWFERAVQTIENLAQEADWVIVEGVGGLLVPVGDQPKLWTCERLIAHFSMPVVLVARRTLGTINHCLLTLSRPDVEFCGLVFNDAEAVKETDIAAQTSPQVISEISGLPILAQIGRLENTKAATLEKVAASMNVSWKN